MSDADHVRLERIARKLASVRAFATLPDVFGADRHRFELESPASEAFVVEFEQRHGIVLPAGYRLFATELGDGGAGPGYRMWGLAES